MNAGVVWACAMCGSHLNGLAQEVAAAGVFAVML